MILLGLILLILGLLLNVGILYTIGIILLAFAEWAPRAMFAKDADAQLAPVRVRDCDDC